MMEAYLIIAEAEDSLDVEAVYIGKQAGATKAMQALRAKDLGEHEWRTEPIEVVDTFGGAR